MARMLCGTNRLMMTYVCAMFVKIYSIVSKSTFPYLILTYEHKPVKLKVDYPGRHIMSKRRRTEVDAT